MQTKALDFLFRKRRCGGAWAATRAQLRWVWTCRWFTGCTAATPFLIHIKFL